MSDSLQTRLVRTPIDEISYNAAEAFSVLKSDERRFDREFYPGDDAFDRADLRYGGIY